MSDRITEKLAIDAIEQASGRDDFPNDGSPAFHDDQGVQYASKTFQRCLDLHGAAQSVSRPGTPLGNAVAESFFKTLERELVKGRDYGTREEAHQDIFKRIELHCHTVRMRSSLDYASPMEYVNCTPKYGRLKQRLRHQGLALELLRSQPLQFNLASPGGVPSM